MIIGIKILFLEVPSVNAEPKIPADKRVGVPIINVRRRIIELWKEILNKIDTIGIKKIIGKHVNIQQHTNLKNKISSTDISEVR